MKHVVQRSVGISAPSRSRSTVLSRFTPVAASNASRSSRNLEVGGEGSQGHSPAGPNRRSNALQDRSVRVDHPVVRPRSTRKAESALAQRDDCVELGVELHPAGITHDEGHSRRGTVSSQLDEGGGDVDAHHLKPATGQLEGVTARAAADVQDPLAGGEFKRCHYGVHLGDGAVCEGVAQVGATQVVCDLLEPVAPVSSGHGVADYPLASAQVAPTATSTANSTRSS